MSTDLLLPLLRGIVFPLLVSTSGHAPYSRGELRERVDLIELNHRYDDLGRHAYDQVIFYEWSPDFCRFHVIAWCLIENDESRLPTQLAGSRDHVVRWYDRDEKIQREIRASLFRETWSKTDPERANKKLLDEKHRVSLMRLPQRIRR
ncbi:hypothetical protein [Aureliella helgolandensis]|uniref:Uncharacterized protein n=1 Tax=Aureliella helgolandensis TaxID=2527968 RepID=A0A518G2R6_9BACT|nr:hypothetical protein [Aureliella helgolandensis]QDV22860.1 hypothetical protein Q31a_11520 [Aureliella helgolandensis]